MAEAEMLSALIGDIYDAALDPSLWKDVLGKVGAFIDGSAVALSWKDAVAKRGAVYFEDGGQDPYYRQLYFDKYIKLDPFTTAQFFAEIGEPKSILEVLPQAEYMETRVYREWARPQDLVDAVMSLLDKSAMHVGFLVVFRHEFADQETYARMRLIIPHLRRAALIGKVIDLKKAEGASLADTLDGISAGMFLVDAAGRIVHANAAGHSMLAAASVLHVAGGRLVANDRHADETLGRYIRDCRRRRCGDRHQGRCRAVGRAGWRSLRRPYAAADLGRAPARRMSNAAVAALFVHKAALDAPSPPEAIAKVYKLTPMELRWCSPSSRWEVFPRWPRRLE